MTRKSVYSSAISLIIAFSLIVPARAGDLVAFNWLSGVWLDERDGDRSVEVIWSAPSGDAMVGAWRQTYKGELKRYEMLTLREIDGDTFYRFDLYEMNEDGEFEVKSVTRLRAISVSENSATFELIGEENWILTMDASGGVLRGWMEDANAPLQERRYNYYARKVAP